MRYVMRLYIAGRSQSSQSAVQRITDICQAHLVDDYELEIIDVFENPELAEEDKIIATPTLLRVLPLPARKIVGDLSEELKVMLNLNIEPAETSSKGLPE